MSLLQRAAQTFAKRSVTDKYRLVAKWLRIGLAMTISRTSWHLLSKHRTRTITPLALLTVHFERGYISTEKEDKKKPYAATFVQAQTERGWELHVNSVIRTGYYAVTNKFRKAREARAEIDFYRAIYQPNKKQSSKSKSKPPRLATSKAGPPWGHFSAVGVLSKCLKQFSEAPGGIPRCCLLLSGLGGTELSRNSYCHWCESLV